jgi:hypothetical protein
VPVPRQRLSSPRPTPPPAARSYASSDKPKPQLELRRPAASTRRSQRDRWKGSRRAPEVSDGFVPASSSLLNF